MSIGSARIVVWCCCKTRNFEMKLSRLLEWPSNSRIKRERKRKRKTRGEEHTIYCSVTSTVFIEKPSEVLLRWHCLHWTAETAPPTRSQLSSTTISHALSHHNQHDVSCWFPLKISNDQWHDFLRYSFDDNSNRLLFATRLVSSITAIWRCSGSFRDKWELMKGSHVTTGNTIQSMQHDAI